MAILKGNGKKFGKMVVWGKPKEQFPILSEVSGRVEFNENALALFHGDDGNRYLLEVVGNAWLPRKGTWSHELHQWLWEFPKDEPAECARSGQ